MKKFILLLFVSASLWAQNENPILGLGEFLGYVKTFHPIVKQANLVVSESDAKLLKSKGAFDPKIEVDYANKEFKSKEYYDKLNATFKIPVWYGIDVKGNFENNQGLFLSPESSVPADGLFSLGVSVSLAKGFLLNERMAQLKQAKFYTKQAAEDQKILVNTILFDASKTYFNWLKFYREKELFASFLTNADLRFRGINKSFELGEKPAIDTLEAKIALDARKLDFEKAKIKYLKASLELANFLWMQNNTPVELQESIIPDLSTIETVDAVLNINDLQLSSTILENHPKLKSLNYKNESLLLEKRLKRNSLLPKIDLQYNFLTTKPTEFNTLQASNYKAGIQFSIPLFLRKERADLKLADLKLQALNYERKATELALKNKIESISQELVSYDIQYKLAESMVVNYKTLVNAEERKFSLGESSLFVVNSRELKFMETALKAISLSYDYLETKAKLFNTLVSN